MKLFKRPDSPYYWIRGVKFADGKRRPVSTNTTSLLESEAFLKSLETKEREEKFFDKKRKVSEITLDELIDDFVKGEINLSKNYYESSLKYTFGIFKEYFKGKFIHQIKSSDFVEFREKRKSGEVRTVRKSSFGNNKLPNDGRVNRDIAGISKVFNWALTEEKYKEVLKENPVIWKKHILKTQTKKKGYLDEDGKQKFLECCLPVTYLNKGIETVDFRAFPVSLLKDIVKVLWVCGFRIEELLGLQKFQIKFSIESVNLSASETKGKKARNVPFRKQEVFDIFERYCKGKKDSELVFSWNNEKISYTTIYNAFDRVIESCGFEAIGIHSLRKTAAIDMYLEGYTLLEIKNVLGHRRIDTTLLYVDEDIITGMLARRRLEAKKGGTYETRTEGFSRQENSYQSTRH